MRHLLKVSGSRFKRTTPYEVDSLSDKFREHPIYGIDSINIIRNKKSIEIEVSHSAGYTPSIIVGRLRDLHYNLISDKVQVDDRSSKW